VHLCDGEQQAGRIILHAREKSIATVCSEPYGDAKRHQQQARPIVMTHGQAGRAFLEFVG
jgi:hypothetical protein